MSNEPKKIVKKVHVTEVVHHGDKLLVPETMTIDQAIDNLQRKKLYDEQIVALHIPFDCFLFDGAFALQKALTKRHGWAGMQTAIEQGFFGKVERPPTMLGVAIGPHEKVQVPWGQMQVPGIDGYLETSFEKTNDGRLCFVLGGKIKRKHEDQVNQLVVAIKEILATESIYKGKAIRLRFRDQLTGAALPMPDPRFLDLSEVRESELIFSESVDKAISASLFTPIERAKECRALGIPLKRGILLAGPFGVGKTLAAYVAAAKAQRSGWTFVYCETGPELADVVRFAQQYAPAVVFCEDIDRIVSGERDIDMDQILSIVDGIESKDMELMIVLTTNEVEEINQAMLRPGRLDSIINVSPPDAPAVIRLIGLYARGLLIEGEDYTPVGVKLEGQIPAVIRECVERSKLHALRMAYPGESVRLDPVSLLSAADEMAFALKLLMPKKVDDRSDIEKAADTVALALKSAGTSNHGSRITEAVTN
jgi:transitional endoplasmic reticulum ATPase